MILPEAQERTLQLTPIVARSVHRRRRRGLEPPHGPGDGLARRIPAQKYPFPRKFPDALLRRQPAQRAVGLLRSKIAHRQRLIFLRKPPTVGKTACIVGRNELCVAVHGNDPLGVLECNRPNASFNHTKRRLAFRQQADVIRLKCAQKVPIFPARRFLAADPQHAPADQQLLGILLFRIRRYSAAPRQIVQNGATYHVGENGVKKRMGMGRGPPCAQRRQIAFMGLPVRPGHIFQLVAQRMGRKAAGPSGGFLRGRNQDLRLVLRHASCRQEGSLCVQRHLQIGAGQQVPDGRQRLMPLPVNAHQVGIGLVGFDSTL